MLLRTKSAVERLLAILDGNDLAARVALGAGEKAKQRSRWQVHDAGGWEELDMMVLRERAWKRKRPPTEAAPCPSATVTYQR